MADTTRKITMGFLPFGSDDESVVLSESLTDGIPTSAGYNAIGSPVFDAGGVIFNTGTDGIYFDLNALGIDYAALYNGCTVSFEIESGALDETLTAEEVLLSFGVSSANGVKLRHTATGYWDLNAQFGSRHDLSSVGKGAYTLVTYVFSKGTILIYWDCLFAGSAATPTTVASAAFAEANLGFKHTNVTGNTGTSGYKIKNLQISNRILSLPTHPEMLNVLIFGDSMPQRGSYPSGGSNKNFAVEETGQGDSFNDAATLPTIQRALAKAGKHIGRSVVTGQNGSVAYNAIKNYTVGGSAVDPAGGATYLAQAIDTALITDQQKLDVGIIWIGSNDITNGWGSDATPSVLLDAAWKVRLTTQINRLITEGAKKVFLCEVVYVKDDSYTDVPDIATGTALLESRQNIVNTFVAEIESDIAEVTHVPLFSVFGGNSPNDAYYATGTTDRHPSSLGSVVAGQKIASIIRG